MHPLHTQEWLAQLVSLDMPFHVATNRRTGKTTAQLLFLLAEVIRNPGKYFKINDHYGSYHANRHACYMLRDMVEKLGLEHIHINIGDHTVIFENRSKKQ